MLKVWERHAATEPANDKEPALEVPVELAEEIQTIGETLMETYSTAARERQPSS